MTQCFAIVLWWNAIKKEIHGIVTIEEYIEQSKQIVILLGGVFDEKIVKMIRQIWKEKVSVYNEEFNEYLFVLAYAFVPNAFVWWIRRISLIWLTQLYQNENEWDGHGDERNEKVEENVNPEPDFIEEKRVNIVFSS